MVIVARGKFVVALKPGEDTRAHRRPAEDNHASAIVVLAALVVDAWRRDVVPVVERAVADTVAGRRTSSCIASRVPVVAGWVVPVVAASQQLRGSAVVVMVPVAAA